MDARSISRRQFLMASAGAAIVAFTSSPHAGAVVDIYKVVDGPLNLRSAPGLSSTILAVLPTGTTMEIIEDGGPKDGYYWVEVWVSSLEKTGFVADSFIERVPYSDAPTWAVGATPVTTTELNLRSGAGLKYPVLVVLWEGAPLTITGVPVSADGHTWYPVKTGYGTTGWVAGEFLGSGTGPAPAFPIGSAVSTTTALNLRSGASLSSSVVVVLWAGAPLTVTGNPVAADGYTWYPVKTGYGTAGWVAGAYLTAGSVTTFNVDDAVRVVDGPLNVRSEPGLGAAVIDVLDTNQLLLVKDGPASKDGYSWYKVWNLGTIGWVAGEFLAYEPGGFPGEEGGV